MKHMLNIGQVSKMYGISLDTLRHYDRIGILKPIIDETNGYRYYSFEHLDLLELILIGKYLEIPLGDMKNLFQSESINKHVKLIENQEKVIKERIKYLQQLKKCTEQIKELLYEILNFKNSYDFNQMLAEDIDLQTYLIKVSDLLKGYGNNEGGVDIYDIETYAMYYRNGEGEIVENEEDVIFSINSEFKNIKEKSNEVRFVIKHYIGKYVKVKFLGNRVELKNYLKELIKYYHIRNTEILVKYEFSLLHDDLNNEYFVEILLPI